MSRLSRDCRMIQMGAESAVENSRRLAAARFGSYLKIIVCMIGLFRAELTPDSFNSVWRCSHDFLLVFFVNFPDFLYFILFLIFWFDLIFDLTWISK